MSKSKQPHPWDQMSELGPCTCSQLRRVTRQITAYYDAAIAESGLTVSQHAILVHISRAGAISRTALALRMGMDRTTLVRNLQPLEKAGYVEQAESEDRRERLNRVSAEGQEALGRSYPLWRMAQGDLAEKLGDAKLAKLRASLALVEEVLK